MAHIPEQPDHFCFNLACQTEAPHKYLGPPQEWVGLRTCEEDDLGEAIGDLYISGKAFSEKASRVLAKNKPAALQSWEEI